MQCDNQSEFGDSKGNFAILRDILPGSTLKVIREPNGPLDIFETASASSLSTSSLGAFKRPVALK